MLFALALLAASYFEPNHRLSGIGAGRPDLSEDLLDVRVDNMVKSQTFAILRDSRAVAGARRITSTKLRAIFTAAAKASGVPATTLEAIAYLESWGESNTESPTGPKGIMQISEATAKRIGLKVVRATRYKVTTEKVAVKRKGKTTYRTVKKKTPYTVTVRDDRLVPERAIPAAARHLAAMQQRFGGSDWAIFAYHCGEGCVAEMMDLTRQAKGIDKDSITVARMFFSCSPAWNRDLYDAIRRQMERDYSPTYWFRIRRAEELLALYRSDAAAFTRLAAQFKNQFNETQRAPHRLSVWLTREDLHYQTVADLRRDAQRRLVVVPDRPEHFGYALRQMDFALATPAAAGTLLYVAYETRRLFEVLRPRGERFQPLEVTALVEAVERSGARPEGISHASGEVFDIAYSGLPAGERECLRFVLNDLGWLGYLGFVEEGTEALHIGCSPTSRAFFAEVYEEVAGKRE